MTEHVEQSLTSKKNSAMVNKNIYVIEVAYAMSSSSDVAGTGEEE